MDDAPSGGTPAWIWWTIFGLAMSAPVDALFAPLTRGVDTETPLWHAVLSFGAGVLCVVLRREPSGD